MISVVVNINGRTIMARSAVNVTPENDMDKPIHTYRVDEGTIIKHERESGAVPLAIKMLETVKE